ncbi:MULTISPECIES: ArnT family glycosyltransferase [unclassified Streptomyces]|uniref:ArnT family glycosyltransferase n=1 Tax=unclassified Streptomyces TaxID=2593676 RepID=UPI00365BE2E9
MSNYAHFKPVSAAPTRDRTSPSVRSLPAWAAPAALGAVLALAAVLYGWALGSLGWGNSYYSAAVKSMGTSWTNFLFGSFDPAGVITVDKPPAALWPQVISSKIFGMHGWALLLPQVIEGVAAVLVLHRTVRRWAGEGAGLVAALVLTLTPITVAINRDNNPDTLLVLLLVSAAYALTRALQEEGRAATWWLCASGFLIGCGFLTKMLAAWMVIPAFAVAWLVGGSGPWIPRVRRLLGAGAILAASSLWWVAMVALWPGDRPYIGGSKDGSAWDLVIGYNGLGRVFGSSDGTPQGMGGAGGGGFGGFGGFGGQSGPGRMFDTQVGGQISWLLPLCALALAVAVTAAVLHRRGKLPASALLPASGWLLWGTWLVVCAAVYSTQEGIFHPYYTTQLAPAIAALCGGLMAGLIRVHRAGPRWAPLAGVAGVAVSVVWAVVLVRRVPDWNGWLVWPVLLVGCAAVVLLVLSRRHGRLLTAAVGAAVASVLVAPGAWALSVPGSAGMGGSNPTAGPQTLGFGGGGGMPRQGGNGGGLPSGMPSGMPSNMPGLPGGDGSSGQSGEPSSGGMPSGIPSGMPTQGANGMPGAPGGSGSDDSDTQSLPGGGSGSAPSGRGGFGGNAELTADQRKILQYAVKHAPDARIKLAVEGGAMSAGSFILGTDETVIGMGGFTNSDNAPSVAQLEKWTKNGELRYILGSDTNGGGRPAMAGGYTGQRSDWIADNCTKVPASSYGGTSSQADDGGAMGFGGGDVLYDCAAK